MWRNAVHYFLLEYLVFCKSQYTTSMNRALWGLEQVGGDRSTSSYVNTYGDGVLSLSFERLFMLSFSKFLVCSCYLCSQPQHNFR